MRNKELKSIVSRIDTLLERAHQFTDSKKYNAVASLLIEYNSIEDHLHQNELIDLQNREYVIDVEIEDLRTATGDPSDKAPMVLEKIILNLTNLRNQVKPGRKKIKNKTSKEVQVAQINACQAIIVALISGIFFIIVTLLSTWSFV